MLGECFALSSRSSPESSIEALSNLQYGYIRSLLVRARIPGPFQGPQTDPFPWSCVASWFDSSDNKWSWRLHIWLLLFLIFCVGVLQSFVSSC